MLTTLVLLADSPPLFRTREDGKSWLADLRETFTRAAYLGASNGDRPEFYEIFEAAMSRVGEMECRHIRADATAEDLEFMKSADLVLLAGGDVELGLEAFAKSGLDKAIEEAFARKALLIGVSAGAVQLGVVTDLEEDADPGSVPDLTSAAFGGDRLEGEKADEKGNNRASSTRVRSAPPAAKNEDESDEDVGAKAATKSGATKNGAMKEDAADASSTNLAVIDRGIIEESGTIDVTALSAENGRSAESEPLFPGAPDLPGEGAHEDPKKNSRGFRFVPFQIDVHREPSWTVLRQRVAARGLGARGIGIPTGGVALVHRDGSLEPRGSTLTELVRSSMGVVESVLLGE